MQRQDADDDIRRELISGFAGGLRELREAVGTPSFRRMAGVSGVISHTTLHEAASGNRFPSWETTREFVKVCGGDERDWRARWMAVKDELSPNDQIIPLRVEVVNVVEPTTIKRRWWTRRKVLAAAVTASAAVAGVIAIQFQKSPYDPLHPGDSSRFIDDLTFRDGTEVAVNQIITKVWEIENDGAVEWQGRQLRRVFSVGGCIAPELVPIGTTPPGDRVKITAIVIAASEPSICKIDYKMVDAQGNMTLPGSRPIFLLVEVVDSKGGIVPPSTQPTSTGAIPDSHDAGSLRWASSRPVRVTPSLS
ncbi:hypothetical protein [Alloactinosynnema sp. L-07]|uniref:NBR1-Ig-like domain-containing protein n=1 Tax=Alloactinosynnema sp. L-07 TaxID=1653480 RepID=UPI00065EFE4A|nr:NBR1-Ig-like domain-containing protein [Alloactinosynnema sp. L-07]CRK61701.1 hypothetical protein [Alloactinosynnema sp. L-07]